MNGWISQTGSVVRTEIAACPDAGCEGESVSGRTLDQDGARRDGSGGPRHLGYDLQAVLLRCDYDPRHANLLLSLHFGWRQIEP